MSAPVATVLVVLSGALIGGGVFAVVAGLRTRPPRLNEVFDVMEGIQAPASGRGGLRGILLSASQRQMLSLTNSSVAEFHADKAVMAIVGALVPTVAGVCATVLFATAIWVPVAAGLVGAVAGFFVPDLRLAKATQRFRVDAAEAVFTYFDLVTLERMANLSAIQALHSAAGLAPNPVFVSIDAALTRARLQQQPPYAELRRLAERLRLPQLADLADVMQLEESGASLSTALRSRVRELRDAHLTTAKIAAHNRSEHMTVFMTIPAMIFGLIYLMPPLMRLLG